MNMIMKKVNLLIFFLFFTLILSAFSIYCLTNIYTIKLQTYSNLTNAEMEQDYLISKGWSPVSIEKVNGENKLMFGEFEYYVDALIYKNDIEKSYGFKCEIISKENTENKALENTQGPLENIFKMKEKHMSEVPDLKLNDSDSLVIEIKSLINGTDKIAYRQKLIEAINTLSNDDIRKGFALTRKGIFELLEKNYPEALEHLKKVANGEVSATREDRIKCIRRVAWIMHQQKDRLGAYKAYREMEAFTGSDYSRVMAKVECAGLLMELARCEKGTLADCRRECEKIIESIPAEYQTDFDFRLQLALTELMHLESWFYDGKYQSCIEEAELFLKKYDEQFNRERGMCSVFLGIAYYNLGSYDNAITVMSQVLNMDIQREWKDVDIKKKALERLILMTREQGDTSLTDYWETVKRTLYNE